MNRRTVQSYALFWLAGLAFLWWPYALLRALADRRPPGRRPIALIITCACLGASLLVAVIRGGEPSRLIAASANLTVWLTVCVLIARQWTRRDAGELIRGVVDLAAFQGVLVVIGWLAYPALSGTTLPLAHFLPASLAAEPNVAAFTTVALGKLDYYNGFVIRTSGIFGNPTWAGAFAAIAILVVLFASGYLGPIMRRPAVRVGMIVLSLLTLYWSYSRVDVLALVVAVVAILAIRARPRLSPHLWLASVCLVVGAGIVLVPNLPLERWYGEANAPRRGSLSTREDIYGATVRELTEAPTPLIGAGIKQRQQGLVASEGTHSTYLGLAYRGGVLCLLSFVFFLFALGYRAIHENAALAVGLVCFLLVWCVTDDIDAGNFVPLAILIAYGLVAPAEKAAGAPLEPARRRPDEPEPAERSERTGTAATSMPRRR